MNPFLNYEELSEQEKQEIIRLACRVVADFTVNRESIVKKLGKVHFETLGAFERLAAYIELRGR